MRKPQWYDVFSNIILEIEWYFAERWLNRTFGKKEYWGEWIMEKIIEEND